MPKGYFICFNISSINGNINSSWLYKSSIFWVLISDKDDFNQKLEKSLKDITVDKEEKKLKYNITS